MPIFPLSDWSISTLRMTAFPVITETRRDVRWWEEVMGAEPDTRTTKTSPAQVEISGSFGIGTNRLTLSVMPLRTDWILSATPTPAPEPDSIGAFPEILPEFVARMRKWIDLSQGQEDRFPIQRLALGVTLHHHEESRIEGYQRIGRYLSKTLSIDPATSSDLVFQINRFTASTSMPGTLINRVNKWGVLAFRFVALSGGGGVGQRTEAADSWSTTVELDISTAADRREPLPDERLVDTFMELVHHAESIASEGDGA